TGTQWSQTSGAGTFHCESCPSPRRTCVVEVMEVTRRFLDEAAHTRGGDAGPGFRSITGSAVRVMNLPLNPRIAPARVPISNTPSGPTASDEMRSGYWYSVNLTAPG